MTDHLIIVPTKGRPHLLQRQYDAIMATSRDDLDIVYVLSEEDADTYSEALEPLPVHILTQPVGATYPSKLNAAAAEFAGQYEYLSLWNDEHEPQTQGWDIRFKAAIGKSPFAVAYGPDGVWEHGEIPSAPMITASMYKALGWVALPGLHHILVDNAWLELAKATDTLRFLPHVRIQHHHRQLGAPDDATYQETNGNQAHQDEDSAIYFNWLYGQGFKDSLTKLEAL